MPHPLWESHPLIGLTILCICLDILHILDLGVLQWFLASAIWTLVHESGLPGDFHARANHIWALLCSAYAAEGTNAREKISREEFFGAFARQTGPKPGSYPELSSKAAKLRHTLPALLRVCEEVHRSQGLHRQEHLDRLECLRNLVRFYSIVEGGGHVLSPPDAAELATVTDAFLRHQNNASSIYWDRGVKLYNVTFKSHLLWHMSRHAKWFNPRHGWAYRDESFVGSVAKVARSIVHGCGAWGLGGQLATKWRRLQWFRLRRRQGDVFR